MFRKITSLIPLHHLNELGVYAYSGDYKFIISKVILPFALKVITRGKKVFD